MYHKLKHLLPIFFLFAYGLWSQNPQSGWSFEYPGDQFTEDAELDLSYLNEDLAGENGFIRLSPNGEGFANDEGEIRFWAINGGDLVRGHDPDLSNNDLREYARFLAKMGVNMIRYHGQMFSQGSDINDPDRTEANNIWRVVTVMKREGIYTTISPFWPAHLEDIPASWGLGDYTGEIDPWGLIYFDQNFRDAYKSWVTHLYTEVNPFTGIALKDDPSVGLIQIINEDGVFFWTIGAVQPSLNRLMQQQFFDWAENLYGNIENAYDAWEQTRLGQDETNLELLEIIQIWHTTDDPNVPPQTNGFKKRLTDQMRFFAETQQAVYQELYDHYRAIGCKQLINASNWKTASSSRLLDLERWSTLPTEVMASNRYYSPGHFGPNSGWRIERLHHYQGNSALHHPHQLPINVKQVVGKPFLITESGWNLPHKYQAEGPFLIAAYQSLTGVDGFYWFSPSATTFEDDPYWPYFGQINGQEPMFRWTNSIPGQIGMFPANALMYRMGYIQRGATVVREERSFESLIRREVPLVTEEKGFDPNRDTYNPNEAAGDTELSPLTYLAGPVQVNYEGNSEDEMISPQLDDLVNISAKKLTSITGELIWDYEQGICVLDAPKAQGICGFPEQKDYELTDVTIRTTNDYVVVNVVSMDDSPLNTSERILVQNGTDYRPTGWEEIPTQFKPNDDAAPIDGFRIENLGRMPWKAANTEVDLIFKNINLTNAWLLDAAGYQKESIAISDIQEGTSISLPADAMYVILEAEQNTTDVSNLSSSYTDIKVYPNPGNGVFEIVVPDKYGDLRIRNVEVLTLEGKRVAAFAFQKGRRYEVKLASGQYFVNLVTENAERITKKMVIEE